MASNKPRTIDYNQSSSYCFERIVLGSMLPFESAFKNVDMNSLVECKKLCIEEGEKCTTIAFGISSRGNGTCQVSSKVLDKSKRRPPGTIFDPDFDLYERKSDCIDLNIENSSSDVEPNADGQPSPPYGTLVSANGQPSSTTGGTSAFNGGSSTTSDDRYSSSSSPYPSGDRNGRPLSSSSYPSSGYESGGITRPFGPTFPTASTYDERDRDTIYFSHDGFPMYKYPMLYEPNYPAPNGDRDRFPATYAPNIPTVVDRYRPLPESGDYQPPMRTTARPAYGSGYGNGYSYGTPTRYGSTRPSSSSYGTASSDPSSRPTSPFSPRPTSTYDIDRPSTYHPRPPPRPLPDTQYAYRPDPVYDRPSTIDGPTGYGGGSPPRPESQQSPISGSTSRPTRPYDRPRPDYDTTSEGKYPTTEAPIETYFNPDDYLEVKWTAKPGNYGGSNYGNRYPGYNDYRWQRFGARSATLSNSYVSTIVTIVSCDNGFHAYIAYDKFKA